MGSGHRTGGSAPRGRLLPPTRRTTHPMPRPRTPAGHSRTPNPCTHSPVCQHGLSPATPRPSPGQGEGSQASPQDGLPSGWGFPRRVATHLGLVHLTPQPRHAGLCPPNMGSSENQTVPTPWQGTAHGFAHGPGQLPASTRHSCGCSRSPSPPASREQPGPRWDFPFGVMVRWSHPQDPQSGSHHCGTSGHPTHGPALSTGLTLSHSRF